MVEVFRLSADVDQSVDRTGAAQNLPARCDDIAIEATGLRFGLVAPVIPLVGKEPAEPERNMKPWVPIFGARFEEKYAMPAQRRQTISENAAGATGANDDEVECLKIRHGFPSHQDRKELSIPTSGSILQGQ